MSILLGEDFCSSILVLYPGSLSLFSVLFRRAPSRALSLTSSSTGVPPGLCSRRRSKSAVLAKTTCLRMCGTSRCRPSCAICSSSCMCDSGGITKHGAQLLINGGPRGCGVEWGVAWLVAVVVSTCQQAATSLLASKRGCAMARLCL